MFENEEVWSRLVITHGDNFRNTNSVRAPKPGEATSFTLFDGAASGPVRLHEDEVPFAQCGSVAFADVSAVKSL
jgi:hypothetical protein